MINAEPRRIEQALARLKGVEAARVVIEDGEIVEIHIAAEPGARPKNIARDVRTYLAAALGIPVSHQKISVAVREEAAPPTPSGSGERQPRILFRSVNVMVEGLSCQAQVELGLGGRPLVGTANGVPCAQGAQRLIARAVLDALQRIIRDDIRLIDGEVLISRVGAVEAVLVEVVLVRPRGEQRLIGACALGTDQQRAVVFATLDAINRIFRRLAPEQWIELRVAPPGGSRSPDGEGGLPQGTAES